MDLSSGSESFLSVEWLTIGAILLGPLIGIWVTRFIDKATELKRQKIQIFNTIHGARGKEHEQDYVHAINLVPIYYGNNDNVMSSWEVFMETAHNQSWESKESSILVSMEHKLAQARENLLTEIGSSIGMAFPKKPEHRRGYSPRLWQWREQESTELRQLWLSILKNQGSLPVRFIEAKALKGTEKLSGNPNKRD